MSGPQQSRVVKTITESPERDVDDVIEGAKTGEKITQIIVTLGQNASVSLQSYAKDEGTNKDDAARSLIEEGLSGKGYIKEEDE